MNSIKLLFSIFLLFNIGSVSVAEPFFPKDNSFVLADLNLKYSKTEPDKINKLKNELKLSPDHYSIAYELAKIYIDLAKKTAEPRYYGLAESVIKPWWSNDKYTRLMLLKVNILEYDHAFSEALLVLNKIIDIDDQAQAILMRANIYQVRGEYDKVKSDCAKLIMITSYLVSAGCFFSVDGFTSSPEKTRILISQLKEKLSKEDEPAETKLWLLGLLAEVASLRSDWKNAEQLMLTALHEKSDDIYMLSLYADLLLKQGRFEECINLLLPHIQNTTLLVRLLVAETRYFGGVRHKAQQKNLDIRIREDIIKDDQRHLREYAYYQLYVKKDYEAALKGALTNWKNQKEIVDSLILYRAAKQTNKEYVLKMLSGWRNKNKVQIDFSDQSLVI